MASDKNRYMIFPDRIYTIEFKDFDGNPFKADVEGSEIIGVLRRGYALEKLINDNPIVQKKDM